MGTIKKDKAIGYCRVSTTKITDYEESLEKQKHQITDYAKDQNLEIVEWFEYVGKESMTSPMSQLDKVLEYCKTNPAVKQLVVTTADRISPYIDGFRLWKIIFERAGVTIVFVDELESHVAYEYIWDSLNDLLVKASKLDSQKRAELIKK